MITGSDEAHAGSLAFDRSSRPLSTDQPGSEKQFEVPGVGSMPWRSASAPIDKADCRLAPSSRASQGLVGVGPAPGVLGAAVWIPIFIVPPLLVTHVMMFRLLLHATGAWDERHRDTP